MALINQNKLFDSLKLYIDKKIDDLPLELQELFEDYKLKDVAIYLDEIKLVGDNIASVIANADNISDIIKVSIISNEVTKVASVDSEVEIVSQYTNEISAVANDIDDVDTVASDMASVVLVAADLQNVNTVASDIADVNTVGANIQDVITVSDNIDVVQDAYFQAMTSRAEAMTSDSYANEPENTHVKSYYYDESTDSILYNDTMDYSALHYSIKAGQVSAGLKFQGTWDSVDCSLPPTPQPTGDVNKDVNGYLYIVTSVSGDMSSCPELTVGDWLIWSGDDPATPDTVEGDWNRVDWTFDWAAITNIPSNVQNAYPNTGGDINGTIRFRKKGTSISDITFESLFDGSTDVVDLRRMDNGDGTWSILQRIGGTGSNFKSWKFANYDDVIFELDKNGNLVLQELSSKDIISRTGKFISRAPSGYNAQYWLQDENSVNRGLLYYDNSNGEIELRRYDDSGNIQTAFTLGATGNVTVNASAPTIAGHLTRKDYVDSIATPVGGIIMFSGDVTTLNSNWALCDGTNGTPDLRGQFIIGGDGSNTGDAGGSRDAVVVSHTHNLTVNDTGHSHLQKNNGYNTNESSHGRKTSANDSTNGSLGDAVEETNLSTTNITVDASTEGVSGTDANLPPYYTLAYIQRIA